MRQAADPASTLGEALAQAEALGVERLVSQVVLARLTGRSRASVIAHPEDPLPGDAAVRWGELLSRAAQGEPLAYLIGEREFFLLSFEVTPDVLIPRPETEELVQAALVWAQARPGAALRIADPGTGSGVIAVTLAVHLPQAQITATDTSAAALAVARRNAARHGVAERVHFVQTDLLAGLDGPFDLIAANLPYIASAAVDTLEVARWEPRAALDGGPDGLAAIRALLAQAPPRLAPGGAVFLEIGHDQGAPAADLCRAAFPDAAVRVLRDQAGRDRIAAVTP